MVSTALKSRVQELHNALSNTQNRCLGDQKNEDSVEVGDGCRPKVNILTLELLKTWRTQSPKTNTVYHKKYSIQFCHENAM